MTDKDRMAAIGVGAAAGAGTAAALNAQDAAATEAGVRLQGFALPEGTAELSIDQQKSILAGLKQELAQLDAMVPQQAAVPEAKAESAKSLTDSAATATPAAGAGLTAMSVLGKESSANAGAEKDSESKDRFNQDQHGQLDSKNHQISKKWSTILWLKLRKLQKQNRKTIFKISFQTLSSGQKRWRRNESSNEP